MTLLSRSLLIAFFAIAHLHHCLAASNSTRRSPHATSQPVNVDGQHKFVPPGHGDLRGPCPGLNALANHNYLPHNGVATVEQFISATHDVFGDIATFSIGGPPPSSLLPPLLGHPLGLSGSHNKYETDVSPTRGDLYQTGDNSRLNLTQFKALYDKQSGLPDSQVNYDVPLLNQYRHERFHESIHSNPYFFNGVFSGVAVQPAAYLFIQRFMANRSGILDRRILKSFFGVSDDFVYRAGWERIPENWYKRAEGDDYDLLKFGREASLAALEYPIFLSVGGNTGTMDSFTGVSPEDLTGGVFNAATLLEGDNLLCFMVEAAVQSVTPDLVKGVVGDVVGAIQRLRSAVEGRGCPPLKEFDTRLLERFPGYVRRK
ncbi:hypothetical protein AAF712_011610 [Marasmius tenuissimus]|uniref:Heme haloperoxidase family profile domain-containing protein n=1 Tax=Marasmius tenuissimus TaxID=585030 RepID=A0ABR2ZJM7_9AGAR